MINVPQPSSDENKKKLSSGDKNKVQKEKKDLDSLKTEKNKTKVSAGVTAQALKEQLSDGNEYPALGIATIRKAIRGNAEMMANKEYLNVPEQRHIDSILDMYRTIQLMSPKLLHKYLMISARGTEVYDETGKDLHTIFEKVWDELTANLKNDIEPGLESIGKTKNLSHKELQDKKFDMLTRYFKTKSDELKKDPRIIIAFAGKEKLLDKTIDFIIDMSGFVRDMSAITEQI